MQSINTQVSNKLNINKSRKLNSVTIIIILIFVYLIINFAYIMSETYRVGSVYKELDKYTDSLLIDYRYLFERGNIVFKNFYIATAFRPYLAKNQLFDYCSNKLLLKVIQSGARCVYIDIFNDSLSDDAFPVVSSGFEKGNWKLTLNTLSFDSVCKTLATSIFTNGYVNNYDDPFVLALNLKTNKNYKCLNRIQETLYKYFKSRLLPSKFSFNRGDLLNTPISDLMGKVIIMTSGGYENSKLEEIVNFSWDKDNFSKLKYKTLIDEMTDSTTIKLNKDDVRVEMKDNYALIVPEEESFFTQNYNTLNFFSTGCQMIAMNYSKVDNYMGTYFNKFKNSSFLEKPDNLKGI